ncbi:MAG TPA: flavodoxin domain-containing protein [Burkholderiaceae bacterium]|nr:flavodoxin domain-containing protein [Burkholderiaceae bacterium]
MQPILVAFATTEGQTRKVAEFIAERLRIRGHRVDLVDVATPGAQQVSAAYQAAFIGGSVHQRRHQGALLDFVKSNLAWLAAMPVALFSVSLAMVTGEMDDRREAQRVADAFIEASGLRPRVTRCVAGALKYTRYGDFKRLVMRMIARQRGRSTDTSQDHEYTDWDDVEAFVDEFLAHAASLARR